MNRRLFASSAMVAAAVPGAIPSAASASSLVTLSELSASYLRVIGAHGNNLKQRIDVLEEFNTAQNMFLGMLSTWWTMSFDAVTLVGRATESGPGSDRNSEAVDIGLLAGTWVAIYNDARKFTAPEPFQYAHELFVEHSRYMAEAAPFMAHGVRTGDSASLEEASRNFRLATGPLEDMEDALGFTVPNRNVVED